MEEGNPFAFGTQPWDIVDEANAGRLAALERTVKIINGETDVMDSWPSPGDEFADGRVWGPGFEQLDEGFSGHQAGDSRAIGIIERHVGHAEDVAIEWQDLVERGNSETDVGDAGAAWCGICHDGKNSSEAGVNTSADDR